MIAPGAAVARRNCRRIHAGGADAGDRRRGARRASAPARRWCSAPRPATRRSTASTPASASWPTSASAAEQLDTLQLNLIRSHSVGVGEPLAPEVVRLMLALKAASLARGHSGVREVVIDTLIAVHNAGLVPYVPAQGSVGASGDLAPLAHMTLALLGEGEMLVDGQRRPALPALQRGRHRAAEAAGQGRPGADQRHADLDRAGAACAVRLRAGARSGAGGRRADGRCGARQRRAVRPAHPRAARPAGADRRGAATTARCWPAARSARRT